MGKSSINGPFSMAMLNNQRVRVVLLFPDSCTVISPRKRGARRRFLSFCPRRFWMKFFGIGVGVVGHLGHKELEFTENFTLWLFNIAMETSHL